MGSRVIGNAAWAPKAATKAVLVQVDAVLAEYRDQWPLTVRQVFYRLVGAHGFPKTEQSYNRLQEYMNRGRRSGRIPWSAIRDDGNTSEDPYWRYTDQDPREWFLAMLPDPESYAGHPQTGQPVFTELMCEAGGMVPMLADAVVEQYGIPVFSGGGFESVTKIREHALRHLARDEEGMATRVLYVGDYDPSGEAMFNRLDVDVSAFGSTAEWVRVAVLPVHIEDYGLPTALPKPTDRRAGFTDSRTVQAEALPPDVLLDLVDAAVRVGWDDAATAQVLTDQGADREVLTDLRRQVDDLLG